MYAIMDVNGKQHKVKAGDIIRIDKGDYEPGQAVTFDQVLYISDGNDTIEIGQPIVANAKVTATVLRDFKDKKIVSFKYKRRKSSSVKQGHRQQYTEIKIDAITCK